MTPLEQIAIAAEEYAKAVETRMRMHRGNSTTRDRITVSQRRNAARARFEELVRKHPNEIVKLVRSHRRLQEAASAMIDTREGNEPFNAEYELAAAKQVRAEAKELLP